ncbi:helix-turn-helix domain-containing protein [Mucilaginibacter litoreus]|uniref:Helix-turn-helix domain-containing protein n=1 Tax=Mucilaginibacter litoreus TaxID=1048221 RepID=A0ABW3AML9_9SPHI
MSDPDQNAVKKPLTFDNLPEAISQLLERVARIEDLLNRERQPVQPENEILNITDAAAFLRLTKSTIYSKVCRGELPAYKTGRRLYFDKAELTEWIKSARKNTNEDTRRAARNYLNKNSLMPVNTRRAYRR